MLHTHKYTHKLTYIHTHTPSQVVAWKCGQQRHVGEYYWCSFPVHVPVSDLRSDPVNLINGRRTVVIRDGCSAIREGGKEGQNSYGSFGTSSTGKSSGRAHIQVDWCCNCTWHSTCLALSPSNQAFECLNAWRQCTDCVCWCQ